MADQDRDHHEAEEQRQNETAHTPEVNPAETENGPPKPETPEASAASSDSEKSPVTDPNNENHQTNESTETDENAAPLIESPVPRHEEETPSEEPTLSTPEAAADKQEDSEKVDEKEDKKDWYILKVQVNRENAIRDSLARRVAIAGLEDHFAEILVPTEKITEFRSGRKRVVNRKLYPGYIVVHMEITDDTWFLVRETPGIGDFTGTHGKPTPMQPHEVTQILATEEDEEQGESPKLKIGFKIGDRVKVKSGTFEDLEGTVDEIDPASGRVKVMITIFNRSTPVELDYWLIEKPD
jgi:transcriptional antiterminator NusG